MVAIRIIIALLAFCISPQTGVFVTVSMITLHIIVKGIKTTAADRERKKAQRTKDEARKAIAIRVEEEQTAKELERQQKQRTENEQRKLRDEQRLARAISTVEFYTDYVRELNGDLSEMKQSRKVANDMREYDRVRELDDKILRLRKRIFEAERKLEEANFIIEQAR